MAGSGVTLLLAEDAWMARRLDRLGEEFGLARVGEDAVPGTPALVVVDLAPPGSTDRVQAARARWPRAVLAGYLAVPDRALWLAGQRAGCDVVANRGALISRLRPLLAAGGARGRQLFPVLDEADLAGRLGLVARIDETPVGPVAVYQIDGAVHVAADRCPHAGAQLSAGELDGAVVTCPGHGSRFDVCSGERLRGPADQGIPTHPVVVGGGQVSIVVNGPT